MSYYRPSNGLAGMKCPASRIKQKTLRFTDESPIGTQVHKMAHNYFKNGVMPSENEYNTLSEIDTKLADKYCRFIDGLKMKLEIEHECSVKGFPELLIQMPDGGASYADYIITAGSELVVIDMKMWNSRKDDEILNQCKIYAGGWIEGHPNANIELVTIVGFYPRLRQPLFQLTMTADDIVDWYENEFKSLYEASTTTSHAVHGSHCKRCPVRAVCSDGIQELMQCRNITGETDSMTLEEALIKLEELKGLYELYKELYDHCKKTMQENSLNKYNGWELKRTAVRKWSDVEKVKKRIRQLTQAGVISKEDYSKLIAVEVISPTKIDELIESGMLSPEIKTCLIEYIARGSDRVQLQQEN